MVIFLTEKLQRKIYCFFKLKYSKNRAMKKIKINPPPPQKKEEIVDTGKNKFNLQRRNDYSSKCNNK